MKNIILALFTVLYTQIVQFEIQARWQAKFQLSLHFVAEQNNKRII